MMSDYKGVTIREKDGSFYVLFGVGRQQKVASLDEAKRLIDSEAKYVKEKHFKNSTSFTNGRNKALAEIGARYPERIGNTADMTAFQQELTSRLGMKIYDYCGVGNGNVTIMPNAPSNVRSLIESIAKAHGVKVNK